jgi:hypothetical protein
MTTISRHVNNGYLSVSHLVCLECELTPEKIGARSRVPDLSKNERASPRDPVKFLCSRAMVREVSLTVLLTFRASIGFHRSYLDQRRQWHS